MDGDIVFNEDVVETPERRGEIPRGFAGRLVARGLVKDEKTANYVLAGIALLLLFSSAALLAKSSSAGNAYGNYDEMRLTHPELFRNNPPPQ